MPFYLYILVYLLFFLAGFSLIFISIHKKHLFINILKLDVSGTEAILNVSKKVKCRVCSGVDCKRLHSELNALGAAFVNQEYHVHERISDAFIDFFDTVFDEFVFTWYRYLTANEQFIEEARFHLRFAISSLLHRVSKISIGDLVCNDVIPLSVAHYEACSSVISRGNLGASGNFEAHLLRHMKEHLHVVMRDRQTEYEYIRNLVAKVLPHLLHPSARNSKCLEVFLTELVTVAVILPSLDTLATPSIVNKLIIVALEDSPIPEATEPPSKMVPLFHRYIHLKNMRKTTRSEEERNISSIYENHILRQAFIDFMKLEDALELFIFFGDLEMINRDIIAPDIRLNVCERIHQDVKRLHDNLCLDNPEILAALQIREDFLQLLNDVVQGSPESVAKLRNSSVWFDAHERACSYLETHYLPNFFISDCYLKAVILEHASTGSKHNSSSARNLELLEKHNLSAAGKSRFFSNVVDGKTLPADVCPAEPAINSLDIADVHLPDLDGTKMLMDEDMSNWRVQLTGLGDLAGESAGLASGVMKYIIHVHSLTSSLQWKTYRKYAEFYVLEEKLREFHSGMLEDVQLPSKKTFGTSSKEFLSTRKTDLESYLRALLGKPFLRQSQLLRLFLTEQSIEFESTLLPDINLNRLTSKFQRRGFYLAKDFLPNLLLATQSPPPQAATQPEVTFTGAFGFPYHESLLQSRLHNCLFWNNASLSDDSSIHKKLCTLRTSGVTGIFDLVFYLAARVLPWDNDTFRKAVLWMLRGLRPLLRPILDSFVRNLIKLKIQGVLQEHRIVPVIHLLKETLFSPKDKGSLDSLRMEEKSLALKTLIDTFPNADFLLGTDSQNSTLRSIFDLVQNPRLNKQLVYVLLDAVVFHVFPEMHDDADSLAA